LAKSLAPSAAACNGMMRSMYPHHHAARAYPYPACNSMAARYGPHQFMNSAAAAAAAGYTQFSAGMPGSMQGMYGGAGGNMAGMAATTAHGQQSTQRLPMAADYGLSLVSDVGTTITTHRSTTSETRRPAIYWYSPSCWNQWNPDC